MVIYIYYCILYICPYGYTSQLAITSISAASVVSAGAIEDCALGVAVLALNALPQAIQAGVRGEMVVAQVIVPACLVIDTETDEYPIIV